MEPFWYRARLVSVYDADSFRCVIDAGFRMSYTDGIKGAPCRLNGIDAPELRGGSDYEKELARAARDATEKWFDERLPGQDSDWPLLIRSVKFDKYGRVLADVFRNMPGQPSLADHLIAERYAVPYHGGTRSTNWDAWVV